MGSTVLFEQAPAYKILSGPVEKHKTQAENRQTKAPDKAGGISIGSGLLRFYIGIEGGIGGFGVAGPGIAKLLGLR